MAIDQEGYGDDKYTKVLMSDNMQLDAFGRQRVSQVNQLVDIKMLNDKLPLLIDEILIGGGTSTFNTNEASITMAVTTNNDAVIRQTKQRYNYQTGKSHLIKLTAYDLQPQANVVKRIGYFNSNTSVSPYNTDLDGLFLETSNGVVSFNIYRNGTLIESTPQSAWNVDRMDGSAQTGGTYNRSRVNIDWTKDQIFFFDFQWLGVGRVRWGFVHDGDFIICHESKHANNIQKVYMGSPNHSLRWEIRSTGGAGSMVHICASVETEGALNENGYGIVLDTSGVALSAPSSGVKYASIVWRFRSGYENNIIRHLYDSILGTTNDNYIAEVILNPTISGVLTYNTKTNTPIEYAIGATTNTVTGGYSIGGKVFQQSVSQDDIFDNSLRLGANINGTSDIFALVVTPLSAGLSYTPIVNLKQIL